MFLRAKIRLPGILRWHLWSLSFTAVEEDARVQHIAGDHFRSAAACQHLYLSVENAFLAKDGLMGIFTHNCVGTNDVERTGRFYDVALAPLGIDRLGNFLDQGLAYGVQAAEFLVLKPIDGSAATAGNGITLGFKAPDRASVDAFHAAGLAAGGGDEGVPGPRGAVPLAYGAYLRDPDGNKICAYCFKPPA